MQKPPTFQGGGGGWGWVIPFGWMCFETFADVSETFAAPILWHPAFVAAEVFEDREYI